LWTTSQSSPSPFEGEVGVMDACLSHGDVWQCKYEATRVHEREGENLYF